MKLDNEEQRSNLLHVLSEHQITGTVAIVPTVAQAVAELMRIVKTAELEPAPAADSIEAET